MRRDAVVTGASSGIGEATVRHLRKAGWNVFAAARRMDRLERLAAETGATPIRLDVTDASSISMFASTIEACHLLVNNAGGAFGVDSIENANIDDWRKMYDTNVLGTLQVTKALLPALRRSGDAGIVIVSSTAAIAAYEGGGGYAAAKHAEHALAATLRLELCGEPLRVIEIAPGMVRTEEFSLNRLDGDKARADAVYENVVDPLTADDIAECITWATSLPSHINVDSLIVRPRVQAAQHRLHRGPLRTALDE